MDPRQIASLIRELARARGEDLSETEIREIITAIGLPQGERDAIVRAWEGRFTRAPSTDRTIRPEHAIQTERVRWRGIPSAIVYVRADGEPTRAIIAADRSDVGAVPFQRPDDRHAWAMRIKTESERRTQEKAALRAAQAPKPGKRRRGTWTGSTYHG